MNLKNSIFMFDIIVIVIFLSLVMIVYSFISNKPVQRISTESNISEFNKYESLQENNYQNNNHGGGGYG